MMARWRSFRKKVVGKVVCYPRLASYGTATLSCGHKATVGRYRGEWSKTTICVICMREATPDKRSVK